jgi:hypothetical protein
LPQDQGSLGVVDLRTMNYCLFSKWALEARNGLWQNMIRAKYLKDKPIPQCISIPGDKGMTTKAHDVGTPEVCSGRGP